MSNFDKLSTEKLSSAPETLLIPLWARSVESKRPRPVLRDEKAVELVDRIDYDFEHISGSGLRPVEICIRATIMDGFVNRFLAKNPTGTVIEIGPGLDTRCDRLDNGSATWVEIDVPEVMAIRQKIFEETERRRFIAASVLEPQWLDSLSNQDPESVFLVAEGVFCYFSKQELISLLTRVSDRFTGCQIVFDSFSPWIKRLKRGVQAAADMAELRCCPRNMREIEQWNPDFHVVASAGFGDSPYYDGLMHHMPRRVRLARTVFPFLREYFRITQLQLG